MKDYKLKLRDLRASHTRVGTGNIEHREQCSFFMNEKKRGKKNRGDARLEARKLHCRHGASAGVVIVRSQRVLKKCSISASEQNEIMYSRICAGSCAIAHIAHVLRCFAYYTSAIVLGLYVLLATELAGHWWMRTGAG